MLMLVILISMMLIFWLVDYLVLRRKDYIGNSIIAFEFIAILLSLIILLIATTMINNRFFVDRDIENKKAEHILLQTTVDKQIEKNGVIDGKLLEKVSNYNKDVRNSKRLYKQKMTRGFEPKKYVKSLKYVKIDYEKRK